MAWERLLNLTPAERELVAGLRPGPLCWWCCGHGDDEPFGPEECRECGGSGVEARVPRPVRDPRLDEYLRLQSTTAGEEPVSREREEDGQLPEP